MFAIQKKFTKTVKSLLTGKEAVREGIYQVPQFGDQPVKTREAKYTDEEAMGVIQEALNYFGPDSLVRFLNSSVVIKVQRRANNDLRGAAAGLSDLDQALVDSLLRSAKYAAELECTTSGADGKVIPASRKSPEYVEAFQSALEFSLSKPKVKHLRPVFEGVEGGSIPFDLTVPGSLSDIADDEEEKTEETEA